ncbi:MAG TPA: hypothetical protein VHO50_08965 [Bacteroidales bacterium]|nr:hypothetical protein [Bacteroidales bacterium]
MENLETTQPVESQITVNTEIKDHLLETAKWGKFLAVVGYIGIGMLILAGMSCLSALHL